MMHYNKLFLTGLLASILFASCESDDTGNQAPLGTYDNGILIVNEGNISAGTITYISEDLTAVQQDVFGAENQGDGLGGYVQSVFFDGDRAFIISNGSNKITVVNRYTFELIDKIETGLNNPRYGVAYNGKAYITNQASFASLTDDFVAVINLQTLALENPIPLNAIGERILEENGKLYVSNGSYGAGSSITVINPATSTTTAIQTDLSPTAMDQSNGVLYVLCSNFDDPSQLLKIRLSDNQILDEIVFPEAMVNAQNLTIEDGKMYFTINSQVFGLPLNATTISTTPLFTSSAANVYGFTVEDNRIYVADAKDFASDGEIFIYNTTGTLQEEFTVGLIPNGFYFND